MLLSVKAGLLCGKQITDEFFSAESQTTQRGQAATKSKESVPQRGSVWVGRCHARLTDTVDDRPTRYCVVVLTYLPPSLRWEFLWRENLTERFKRVILLH